MQALLPNVQVNEHARRLRIMREVRYICHSDGRAKPHISYQCPDTIVEVKEGNDRVHEGMIELCSCMKPVDADKLMVSIGPVAVCVVSSAKMK